MTRRGVIGLALLLLPGCPVEQLGIELPPPGAAAISVDDLQRDVAGLLARQDAWFEHRMVQMHFEVARGEGWVCGARGEGSGRAFVAAWPVDVDHASTSAVMIAMAKGWDTVGELPGVRRYCIGAWSVAPAVRLGAFAPGPLPVGADLPADGAPMTSGTPDATRRPEAVDYRELAEKARMLFVWDGGPGITAAPPTRGPRPRSP